MTWTVRYTKTAAKAILRLDPTVRTRVRAAIDTLRDDPYRGKPLQLTLQGLFSWRTGDWRIVYRVKDEHLLVFVVRVGNRGDVYRGR